MHALRSFVVAALMATAGWTVTHAAERVIQVLCPMNRGGVGARSLNIELQAALIYEQYEAIRFNDLPEDRVLSLGELVIELYCVLCAPSGGPT